MSVELRQLSGGVVYIGTRRYPGIVIMGDTLASMAKDVKDALDELKRLSRDSNSKQVDRLEYVYERLSDALNVYVRVLNEHNVPLPFPATESD